MLCTNQFYDINMTEDIAKKLEYRGEVYKYSHSKKNILIYVQQPAHYYDDWEEDGGILVVEYRPKTNNHQYIVIHSLRVSYINGYISHEDISNFDKIAKPYVSKS